jgi:thiaminase
VNRRGPNNKRARDGQPIAPNIAMAPNVAPSLTSHLLTICSGPFAQATQRPFLSHAGCGSLGAGPLSQWLVQDGHYARGYIRFIGQLLAKIRLPQTHNSQFHPMYRTMDLLISALNNMRREMQFFEITATKYGLAVGMDPPTPITRAMLDLLVSASSASASLLEGMVVLWASEHVRITLVDEDRTRLTSHSATAPPGNTPPPSLAPSTIPPATPTSSPSTKPSYQTGPPPPSANSTRQRAH